MEFNASEIAASLNELDGLTVHFDNDFLYVIVEQAPGFPSGWSAVIEANVHALGVKFQSNGKDNDVFGNGEEFVIEGVKATELFGATRDEFLTDPVAALSTARTSIDLSVRKVEAKYRCGNYDGINRPLVDRYLDELSPRQISDIRDDFGHRVLESTYWEWLLENGLRDDIAQLVAAHDVPEAMIVSMIKNEERLVPYLVMPGYWEVCERICERREALEMDTAA